MPFAQRLGYPEGLKGLAVVQIKPDTPAAGSLVRPGDLLVELNHQPITSLNQYQGILSKLRAKEVGQLLFRRGEGQMFVVKFEKN